MHFVMIRRWHLLYLRRDGVKDPRSYICYHPCIFVKLRKNYLKKEKRKQFRIRRQSSKFWNFSFQHINSSSIEVMSTWSQWIALVRRHAEIIVNDKTVFPVFRKFCKVCREAFSSPISIFRNILKSFEDCYFTVICKLFISWYLAMLLGFQRWPPGDLKWRRKLLVS